MHTINRYTRKHWSHFGAVRSQRVGDLAEFDPGNWVYAKVLGLLCPAYMRTVDWDICTKEDICEALLALNDDLSSPHNRLNDQSQRFKELVLEFGPVVNETATSVWIIYNRCPNSAERHLASLSTVMEGFEPLQEANSAVQGWPTITAVSPTAQNRGSWNPPPAREALPHRESYGKGSEPLAEGIMTTLNTRVG